MRHCTAPMGMREGPSTIARSTLDSRASPGRRVARGLLAAAMGCAVVSAAGATGAQTIAVDASNSPSGNPHFWSTCVGTGTASLTLRADLQAHYKLAHRELGMGRVRGHGLLNDDMGIFHWSGGGAAPTYDWSKFDTYLAAIDAAGMRPMIELSFMPTDLASSGNDRNPPSDLDVYRQMIQAVVQHAVDLYGAEDVGRWYWEVWNEPNYPGFWTGTMDDYFQMYDAAAAGATGCRPLDGRPCYGDHSTKYRHSQHVQELPDLPPHPLSSYGAVATTIQQRADIRMPESSTKSLSDSDNPSRRAAWTEGDSPCSSGPSAVTCSRKSQ